MISLKTKYALKALITLAEEKARGGHSLTIEEIAARGTPRSASSSTSCSRSSAPG